MMWLHHIPRWEGSSWWRGRWTLSASLHLYNTQPQATATGDPIYTNINGPTFLTSQMVTELLKTSLSSKKSWTTQNQDAESIQDLGAKKILDLDAKMMLDWIPKYASIIFPSTPLLPAPITCPNMPLLPAAVCPYCLPQYSPHCLL